MWAALAIQAGVAIAGGIMNHYAKKREAAASKAKFQQQEQQLNDYLQKQEPMKAQLADIVSGKAQSAAEQQMRLGLEDSSNQLVGAAVGQGAQAFKQASRMKQRVDTGLVGETAAIRSAEQNNARTQLAGLESSSYQARSALNSGQPVDFNGMNAFMGGFGPGWSAGAALTSQLPQHQSATQKESAKLDQLEADQSNVKRRAALGPKL